VLGVGSLAVSTLLGARFAYCAAFYLALNVAYSFRLKEIVILDVLSISLGFVLRAVAGGFAVSVQISDWLLVCTFFLALFLALAKRRHELVSLATSASGHRKILAEYSPYLLDQMISVVTASCLISYAFYTMAPDTVQKYRTERLAWTIPFVLYGIFRYLYLVHQKEQGGSPTDILATDRPLILNVFLWAAALVWIVYSASGNPMPLVR
jgi:4-hydroxybenzoate polyprenyltransferase